VVLFVLEFDPDPLSDAPLFPLLFAVWDNESGGAGESILGLVKSEHALMITNSSAAATNADFFMKIASLGCVLFTEVQIRRLQICRLILLIELVVAVFVYSL